MKKKNYALRRPGGSEHVMAFTEISIHCAAVYVMYSTEFVDHRNHVVIKYNNSGTGADIHMLLPFGLRVTYKLEEIGDNDQ